MVENQKLYGRLELLKVYSFTNMSIIIFTNFLNFEISMWSIDRLLITQKIYIYRDRLYIYFIFNVMPTNSKYN